MNSEHRTVGRLAAMLVALHAVAACVGRPGPTAQSTKTTGSVAQARVASDDVDLKVLHKTETSSARVLTVLVAPTDCGREALVRLGRQIDAANKDASKVVAYLWNDERAAYQRFDEVETQRQRGLYSNCATFDPETVLPEHFVATYFRDATRNELMIWRSSAGGVGSLFDYR